MAVDMTWTRSGSTSTEALVAIEAQFPDLWLRVAEADLWLAGNGDTGELWNSTLDTGILDREGALPTPHSAEAIASLEFKVEAPIHRRRQLLGGEASTRAVQRSFAGGICWYIPEDDCYDSAAKDASNGLFNAHNMPAWDTWLALRRLEPALAVEVSADYSVRPGPCWVLLAWIPACLLERAAHGIWANPEGCIGWLSDPRRP